MSFAGRSRASLTRRTVCSGVSAALLLVGCTSSADSTDSADPTKTDATSAEVSAVVSDPSSTAAASTALPESTGASGPLPSIATLGCLTSGSLSGAFEEKALDVRTEVNTSNVGENAPDAYYATRIGKNTVGYFVFGKKVTLVVNGDGSWSGESGTDVGTIDVAADGSGATVKATIEGSDANGQRAEPLTVDLVTRCGVALPTTIAPAPVNTKQNVTEIIVEATDPATTPS